MSEGQVTSQLILIADDHDHRLSLLETQENSPYKGVSAIDFTAVTLPHHGDYGYQTADTELQMNCNGVIRAWATAVGAPVSGAGVAGQVTYWTAGNVVAGDAGFTYSAGTNTATLSGGLVLDGGANSVITVNDNVANAFTLVEAGLAVEYLRIVTTNAQPIIRFNNSGLDVDFYVETIGVADALFIRGADGQIMLGVLGAGVVQSTAGGVLSSDYTIDSTLTMASGQDFDPTDASGQELGNATHRWDLFTEDIVFGGASGANIIVVPDNVADAWHLDDAGGLEYVRVLSENAKPYLLLFPSGGGNVGIATAAPDRLFHAEVSDAATNIIVYAQRLSHITSNTAVNGFGTGIEFELEENDGSNRIAGIIECAWSDAGEITSADGYFRFRTMLNDVLSTDTVTMGDPTAQLAVYQYDATAARPTLFLGQVDEDMPVITIRAWSDGIGNSLVAVDGITPTLVGWYMTRIIDDGGGGTPISTDNYYVPFYSLA